VTVGPSSQRTSGYACAVLGVLLAVAGLGSVRGFREFRGEPSTVELVSPSAEQASLHTAGGEQG
jgi:hypothetical protein